jgi:hypothetical protein
MLPAEGDSFERIRGQVGTIDKEMTGNAIQIRESTFLERNLVYLNVSLENGITGYVHTVQLAKLPEKPSRLVAIAVLFTVVGKQGMFPSILEC